jgi:hypothetical protein
MTKGKYDIHGVLLSSLALTLLRVATFFRAAFMQA